MSEEKIYPYDDGDFITIGPQCFTDKDESVINWRGVNYIRAAESTFGRAACEAYDRTLYGTDGHDSEIWETRGDRQRAAWEAAAGAVISARVEAVLAGDHGTAGAIRAAFARLRAPVPQVLYEDLVIILADHAEKAVMADRLRTRDGGQAAPISREELGRLVRETWVAWAAEQPNPKPSWLTGWEQLDHGQREVDMRIGEAIAKAVMTPVPPG